MVNDFLRLKFYVLTKKMWICGFHWSFCIICGQALISSYLSFFGTFAFNLLQLFLFFCFSFLEFDFLLFCFGYCGVPAIIILCNSIEVIQRVVEWFSDFHKKQIRFIKCFRHGTRFGGRYDFVNVWMFRNK